MNGSATLSASVYRTLKHGPSSKDPQATLLRSDILPIAALAPSAPPQAQQDERQRDPERERIQDPQARTLKQGSSSNAPQIGYFADSRARAVRATTGAAR